MDDQAVFKAMADATRRNILQLASRQELSVSELVDCLRQPQSTVSRHLKVLRDAGLLHDRREGTAVLYAAPENATNGNGDADLQGHLVHWLADRPLPPSLARRLRGIVQRRAGRSDAFFSQVGHRWDQMRLDAFGDAFHLEALAMLLPGDWTVADIGTGTGYLLPTLGRAVERVIAVDPVAAMLDIARDRAAAAGVDNVSFREGGLSRLPLDDGAVDLALAVLVLHHVPSPADALAEICRVVRPGGRVLIVEQYAHSLEAFHDRMQDRWWGFEPEALAESVTSAGFDAVRHRRLPANGAADAPDLFALTATRPDGATPSRN